MNAIAMYMCLNEAGITPDGNERNIPCNKPCSIFFVSALFKFLHHISFSFLFSAVCLLLFLLAICLFLGMRFLIMYFFFNIHIYPYSAILNTFFIVFFVSVFCFLLLFVTLHTY